MCVCVVVCCSPVPLPHSPVGEEGCHCQGRTRCGNYSTIPTISWPPFRLWVSRHFVIVRDVPSAGTSAPSRPSRGHPFDFGSAATLSLSGTYPVRELQHHPDPLVATLSTLGQPPLPGSYPPSLNMQAPHVQPVNRTSLPTKPHWVAAPALRWVACAIFDRRRPIIIDPCLLIFVETD